MLVWRDISGLAGEDHLLVGKLGDIEESKFYNHISNRSRKRAENIIIRRIERRLRKKMKE